MASDRDTLPDSVKPIHYALSLRDLEFGGNWSYQGTVSIDVHISKGTNEIVLNAKELVIHSAELSTELSKTEEALKATNITYDENSQRAKLEFAQELPVTPKASLLLKFQGTMNNKMAGFYRSRYKAIEPIAESVPKDEEYHYMFSTQFESCDARRAFPCFDEPNRKATFDFSIEVPEGLTALSNMPEKQVTKSDKTGRKLVTFETTPIMSTYLLAWAVGDFEYVEDFTRRKYNGKNLPVRVYTTKGLKEQARFALENAHLIVDYFSEIFEIEYPLPKVDLLAVHEFTAGAMENWGLITYRTTAVLFDEEKSDQKYKNRVAYVVAHELAHQWFGNLVTMDWWNELWLNEGFATWVGWLAIDHFYKDWDIWGQFVSESVQTAHSLDSLRKSHPIEVPVRDALEVDQVFDAISYLKGSSVIRMLSSHLGVEVFLKGVAKYLQTHKYGNARTHDLWSALSSVSGQDVNTFMDVWIQKIGFPVLTVAEEPGQVSVKQNRFLISGDVQPEEDSTVWWIPLGLKTGSQATTHSFNALTKKEDTIRDVDESFYKFNANQTGFYRTNYPPERLVKLGQAKNRLSTEDKIGLLGDAAALATSGHGTTAGFLALVEGFKDEQSYIVWAQILTSLGNIRSVFSDVPDVSEALKTFTRKLVSDAAEKVGWEFKPNEGFLTGQLRSLLIAAAGRSGHEEIIKEALRQFEEYTAKGNHSAINPSLKSAVFRIAVSEGGLEAFKAVQKDYSSPTISSDGKEICLQAMGQVQTADEAKAYLDFTFSPAVAVQDRHSPASSLGANPKTRPALWEYIKANFDSKIQPQAGNSIVLERFLRLSLNKWASFEVEQEIQTFFADKDTRGFDRGLAVVCDTIKGNAKYKERDTAVVREWLSAHGYN